jgi:hypothetical protein
MFTLRIILLLQVIMAAKQQTSGDKCQYILWAKYGVTEF